MHIHMPVGLYRGFNRLGKITFHTLFVEQPSDYTCEPQGILADDEARDLLRQVRQTPLSCQGVIGKYAWLT